jgi:hypothetical protein
MLVLLVPGVLMGGSASDAPPAGPSTSMLPVLGVGN